MPLPPMTPEQRAANLAAAQRTRAARSAVRKNLKDGALALADVLDDGGEITAGMKVRLVLESLPGTGKATAARAMQSIGIAENRRVGALSARQRAALEEKFGPLPA
jgi:S13-like protein